MTYDEACTKARTETLAQRRDMCVRRTAYAPETNDYIVCPRYEQGREDYVANAGYSGIGVLVCIIQKPGCY